MDPDVSTENGVLAFFNGTVMRGQPDHINLTQATFLATVRTAEKYRLYSINDAYPAMIPVESKGVPVLGELYRVPPAAWDDILQNEPDGLHRDRVELEDGRVVYGMVASLDLVSERGTDISSWGDWRAYSASLVPDAEIDP